MCCRKKIVTNTLLIFNIFCALCGIGFLIIGIMVLVKSSALGKVFGAYTTMATTAPVLVITLGSIVFLVAICGCCGASMKSYSLTMIYATFLLILLIGKIVMTVLAHVFAGDIATAAIKSFKKIFHAQEVGGNKEIVDTVQKQLECCGLNGPEDWQEILIGHIPSSCCTNSVTLCNIHTAFNTGCISAIEDWIYTFKDIMAWVGLCIAAIELVALLFACILGNQIRRKKKRNYS
ncbi:Tetraspanin [Sergentomyia squamirostris]